MGKKKIVGVVLIILAILIVIVSFSYFRWVCVGIENCMAAYPYPSYFYPYDLPFILISVIVSIILIVIGITLLIKLNNIKSEK